MTEPEVQQQLLDLVSRVTTRTGSDANDVSLVVRAYIDFKHATSSPARAPWGKPAGLESGAALKESE